MKTIQEILDAFENWTQQPLGGAYLNSKPVMIKEDALKEIHDLILESLPELKTNKAYFHRTDGGEVTLSQASALGYKYCLDDTKANLLKILGGEK